MKIRKNSLREKIGIIVGCMIKEVYYGSLFFFDHYDYKLPTIYNLFII